MRRVDQVRPAGGEAADGLAQPWGERVQRAMERAAREARGEPALPAWEEELERRAAALVAAQDAACAAWLMQARRQRGRREIARAGRRGAARGLRDCWQVALLAVVMALAVLLGEVACSPEGGARPRSHTSGRPSSPSMGSRSGGAARWRPERRAGRGSLRRL